MLFAAGGTRTGGNFKAAAAPGPMGWQVADRWASDTCLLLTGCSTSKPAGSGQMHPHLQCIGWQVVHGT